MKKSNIDILETFVVSVTPDKLSLFYSKCHQHQTSTIYKARAFLMVDNIPNICPNAVSHLAYQFTVSPVNLWEKIARPQTNCKKNYFYCN